MVAKHHARPASLICPQCGKSFKVAATGKLPSFCSAQCRVYFHRAAARTAHLPNVQAPKKGGGK